MPGRLDPTYTKKQVDDIVGVISSADFIMEDLYLDAVGTFSFAKAPYVTTGYRFVEIITVGSGGGAAGCPLSNAGQQSMGGPGGSGGWARKLVALSALGANEDYTVGAGGIAGGSGANGGDGNPTSFGTVPICSASGGKGGTVQTSLAGTTSIIRMGEPGVGTVGDFLGSGSPVQWAFFLGAGGSVNGFLPPGGSNPYGVGGKSNLNAVGDIPSIGYGGGGGGSVSRESQGARVGTAGRKGGIIMRFFG